MNPIVSAQIGKLSKGLSKSMMIHDDKEEKGGDVYDVLAGEEILRPGPRTREISESA